MLKGLDHKAPIELTVEPEDADTSTPVLGFRDNGLGFRDEGLGIRV